VRGLRRRFTLEQVAEQVAYGGHTYPLTSLPGSPAVEPDGTFAAYVTRIHRRNGVVPAAVAARSMLMSQLRFLWRSEIDLRTFGTAELGILEFPAPDLQRSRMLTVIEQHVSYAGASYVWRRDDDTLRLLNPDWVSAVIAADNQDDAVNQADAHVVGYLYRPGGKKQGDTIALGLGEVAQVAPEPDPLAWWRGQAWVTSLVREIVADGQATDHLQKFFANAAKPQMVFTLPATIKDEALAKFRASVEESSAGVHNAYRNLYLAGGADVNVVGSMLQQLDMKGIQGGVESRIAARSRVPATVLGIREGMQGSALNAGNYSAARRMWADGWFSPTAEMLAESLEHLIPRPGNDARLVPDISRVLFLQEDRKDEADILASKVSSLKQLVDAGYDPISGVDAIETNDLRKLEHSGLYSVQLQPPGSEQAAPDPQEG
jgi:hypothetical protein